MWKTAAAAALTCLVLMAAAAFGGYKVAQNQLSGDMRHMPLDRPGNLFDQHLLQSGIFACADTFGRLGADLTNGAPFGIRSRWKTNEAGTIDSIYAQVGMALPDGNGGLTMPGAGIVFAAGVENKGCAGLLVRVTSIPATCDAFAQGRPEGARLGPTLQNLKTVELATGQDLILLPVGNSCVALSQQTG